MKRIHFYTKLWLLLLVMFLFMIFFIYLMISHITAFNSLHKLIFFMFAQCVSNFVPECIHYRTVAAESSMYSSLRLPFSFVLFVNCGGFVRCRRREQSAPIGSSFPCHRQEQHQHRTSFESINSSQIQSVEITQIVQILLGLVVVLY